MKNFLLLFLTISIFVNIILGIFVVRGPTTAPHEHVVPSASYTYLSPRLFTNNQNDIIINFVKLREDLRSYAKNLPGLGIYFEYLPSGVSAGVNEKQNYFLASLLKTPMVMAVYRQIEKGDWKKDDVLTVEASDLDPLFGDLYKKGAGTKITLEDAIRQTLVYSDNTAKSVLFSHLPDGSLEDVFDYLDIPKELDGVLPVVTPKNYSSVLRSLYLSSYLEKEDSNEILDYMTQSPFDDKLAAGLPKDVKVSHKIGVYDEKNPEKSIFTDCGIIYVPKRPYILCLMDRDSEANAKNHMSDVSKMIYEYVTHYDK